MTIYYYNGKVVRKSKRNTYRYGLYCPKLDKVIALSSTATGAAKENNSYINIIKKDIEYFRREKDLEMVKEVTKDLEVLQARYIVELEKVEK